MRLLFVVLLAALAASCNSRKAEQMATPMVSPPSKIQVKVDTSDDFEQPDLKEVRKDYIKSYDEVITLDTSFIINNKASRILFKHFCTWDSSVVIPAEYDFESKRRFVTHNFQSELTFIQEGDTVFKKLIRKEDFDSLLYSALKKYATLSGPYLKLENDSIDIHYSISIPVTDVGIGATIVFDDKGNYYAKE